MVSIETLYSCVGINFLLKADYEFNFADSAKHKDKKY